MNRKMYRNVKRQHTAFKKYYLIEFSYETKNKPLEIKYNYAR